MLTVMRRLFLIFAVIAFLLWDMHEHRGRYRGMITDAMDDVVHFVGLGEVVR
jgi:hypothetical protein